MSGTSTVSVSGNATFKLEPPDKTLRKYTAGKEHTSKKIYSWERESAPKLKIKNMCGIYTWERESGPKALSIQSFKPLPRLSKVDKFSKFVEVEAKSE